MADGINAWEHFRKRRPDLVVSANRMPGIRGIELLSRVRAVSSVPFVIEVEAGDVSAAVLAARSGADEIVQSSLHVDGIRDVAERVARTTSASIRSDLEARIPGKSAILQRLREKVRSMAGLQVPVLFVGEPGSGRTHLARLLSTLSGDADRRLIEISTGAPEPSPSALSGCVDIVLRDVATLSEAERARWSQHLLNTEKNPGDCRVRILATSDSDLRESGSLDLCCQRLAETLSRFVIEVPPLRSYLCDLRPLAERIADDIATRLGRPRPTFTTQAVAALQKNPWPGNVRELREAIEQLVAFSADGRITKSRVVQLLDETTRTVAAMRHARAGRQRAELMALLHDAGGNLAEVARRLGMSRGAIIYRAQKFGLLPERRRRSPERAPARPE